MNSYVRPYVYLYVWWWHRPSWSYRHNALPSRRGLDTIEKDLQSKGQFNDLSQCTNKGGVQPSRSDPGAYPKPWRMLTVLYDIEVAVKTWRFRHKALPSRQRPDTIEEDLQAKGGSNAWSQNPAWTKGWAAPAKWSWSLSQARRMVSVV